MYSPTHVPTHVRNYPPFHLRIYVPPYLPSYPPTYLHTHLRTFLPTYLHTHLHNLPPPSFFCTLQRNILLAYILPHMVVIVEWLSNSLLSANLSSRKLSNLSWPANMSFSKRKKTRRKDWICSIIHMHFVCISVPLSFEQRYFCQCKAHLHQH